MSACVCDPAPSDDDDLEAAGPPSCRFWPECTRPGPYDDEDGEVQYR